MIHIRQRFSGTEPGLTNLDRPNSLRQSENILAFREALGHGTLELVWYGCKYVLCGMEKVASALGKAQNVG